MSDSDEQFRTVLRGYEPTQVDQRIRELAERAAAAERRADELREMVGKLESERERAGAEAAPPAPATFEHLGQRVGAILTLADEEANSIRSRAEDEVEELRARAAEDSGRIRAEADRYAENRRRDADTESARILEDRKQAAEAEFQLQMDAAQQRHADLEALIERQRNEADAEHAEAVRRSARLVEDAEQKAAGILSEAKTAAARVRADSDRELAAATQRRDSINAQLANVRQMLVTLTGSAPAALLDEPAAEQAPPESAQSTEAARDDEGQPA